MGAWRGRVREWGGGGYGACVGRVGTTVGGDTVRVWCGWVGGVRGWVGWCSWARVVRVRAWCGWVEGVDSLPIHDCAERWWGYGVCVLVVGGRAGVPFP